MAAVKAAKLAADLPQYPNGQNSTDCVKLQVDIASHKNPNAFHSWNTIRIQAAAHFPHYPNGPRSNNAMKLQWSKNTDPGLRSPIEGRTASAEQASLEQMLIPTSTQLQMMIVVENLHLNIRPPIFIDTPAAAAPPTKPSNVNQAD